MFALAADISLRIVAAAAAVGLVLAVLRVRSGAARHAAWSAVLLAMLTMPGLMAIVPRVDVPVPSSLALDFEGIAGELNPYEPLETPVRPDFTEPQLAVAVTSLALEAKESPSRLAFDWRIAAVAVYAAGALFFFVRIGVGWILARRLIARAIRVACDNRAPVFESPAVATPMTTGIVSPCVLLPVTWREWPEDKLQAVLAHENAHIARRDSLVALLAHANRAIFWFHPLEASSDPNLLAAAGYALMRRYTPAVSDDALGRRCLERAATLDPQNPRAQSALAELRHSERRKAIQGRLQTTVAREPFDEFSDTRYAAITALPAEDRLFYLPGAAESAYMRAEYIDYTAPEKPEAEQAQARKRAAQGFARARQYADDALALARNHQQAAQDNDVIYRAETVLGVLALKDGDHRAAVAHMRTSGAAPISDAGRYASHFGLRGRLLEYLLRAGERTSVAEYLEKSAERYLPERDRLLKDAAQIRVGVMPLSYQYAEARR